MIASRSYRYSSLRKHYPDCPAVPDSNTLPSSTRALLISAVPTTHMMVHGMQQMVQSLIKSATLLISLTEFIDKPVVSTGNFDAWLTWPVEVDGSDVQYQFENVMRLHRGALPLLDSANVRSGFVEPLCPCWTGCDHVMWCWIV